MSAPHGKLWATVLIVSLGLNVFVIGMLVARWAHGPRPGEHLGPGPSAMPWDVGPGARQVSDRVWQARRSELEPRLREARDAKVAAVKALGAEPFDPAAAERSLGELRAKSTAVQETLHGAVLDLAKELPASERRRLADSLEMGRGPAGRAGGPWGAGRRGGRHGFGPGRQAPNASAPGDTPASSAAP